MNNLDLWIRSQDKRKLLKCNDIAVEQNMIDQKEIIKFKGYKIVGYFDKNTEYEELGIYATEERVLEVLDEIQDLFITKEALTTEFTKDGLTIMNKQPSSVVYEMPQE